MPKYFRVTEWEISERLKSILPPKGLSLVSYFEQIFNCVGIPKTPEILLMGQSHAPLGFVSDGLQSFALNFRYKPGLPPLIFILRVTTDGRLGKILLTDNIDPTAFLVF